MNTLYHNMLLYVLTNPQTFQRLQVLFVSDCVFNFD